MEIIACIKEVLSPFLFMNLYLILHHNSCTATTLSCHFRNIEVESNEGSHLESLDALGPGSRILKYVLSLVDCQTVPYFLQTLNFATLFSNILTFARS